MAAYWDARLDREEEVRILPAHIEETIRAIAKLHEEHHAQATAAQRALERATDAISSPRFVYGLTVGLVLWIGGNLLAPWLGYKPWDEPPFDALNALSGVLGLYVAVIILSTQRRADQLSGYRDQLTLELSILSEQKSAKIIELLEELRRDDPHLRNRYDPEADALAKPADPQTVFEAIKDAHDTRDIVKELSPDGA
jgi:uncharacterized membrane protein